MKFTKGSAASLVLALAVALDMNSYKAAEGNSSHPAAGDIGECNLISGHKNNEKCLQTKGYERGPWHYFPTRCGTFYKFEKRNGESIVVVELRRGCKESEDLSRRWDVNCKNKDIFVNTSNGERHFYGLLEIGEYLNYACYIFRDTGK